MIAELGKEILYYFSDLRASGNPEALRDYYWSPRVSGPVRPTTPLSVDIAEFIRAILDINRDAEVGFNTQRIIEFLVGRHHDQIQLSETEVAKAVGPALGVLASGLEYLPPGEAAWLAGFLQEHKDILLHNHNLLGAPLVQQALVDILGETFWLVGNCTGSVFKRFGTIPILGKIILTLFDFKQHFPQTIIHCEWNVVEKSERGVLIKGRCNRDFYRRVSEGGGMIRYCDFLLPDCSWGLLVLPEVSEIINKEPLKAKRGYLVGCPPRIKSVEEGISWMFQLGPEFSGFCKEV